MEADEAIEALDLCRLHRAGEREEGRKVKYGQMDLSVELVTPSIARRWLDQANTDNRRLRKSVVRQYARDMERGDWHRKPVAVCFDENDKLGNGQHTLNAIAESGVAQELLVARNVPKESIAAMDLGLRRTIADIAHFVGSEIGSREAAIAKVLVYGIGDMQPRSFAELFNAYEPHRDVIDDICRLSPKRSGFGAAVLAVCVRAWTLGHEDDVRRFLRIVDTGVVESECDSAAIRLRDFCRSLRGGASLQIRTETYRRAESALDHFIRRKPIVKLYGTERELFPLPNESEPEPTQRRKA